MNKLMIVAVAFTLTLTVTGNSPAALNVQGVWDTNWGVQQMWQTDAVITGEYVYDNGLLNGALEGNTFRGWWREYDNEKECGPGGQWGGPVAFLFADDGLSFTGDWGYCGTSPETLNINGSRWTGTRRASDSITQSECEGANRYWCNGICQPNPCQTAITQEQCELSGRFWCSGICQYTPCDASGEIPSLELTYPVGQSPKVFTVGWLFGAACSYKGTDCSAAVKWGGTGTFSPDTGDWSRPTFHGEGSHTIELSVEVDGLTARKSYTVETVQPVNYARVGDLAGAPTDAHGCPACPHDTSGPITSGSLTVLIDGRPAARVGDIGVHASCCGPNTFEIVGGDPTVLIDGRRAAELNSETKHCGGSGHIIQASTTIVPPRVGNSETIVRIPALELPSSSRAEGDNRFWLDLILAGVNPIRFALHGYGATEIPGGAASLDLATGNLHIPSLHLGGGVTYWIDLTPRAGDQLYLELADLGANVPRPEENPQFYNVRPISGEDLWDVSRGVVVTAESGTLPESPALNVFRAGNARFQDGQPVGTEHWVEWKTPAPVTVASINLVAMHGSGINERGFSRFRLFSGDGRGNWVRVYQYETDPDGDRQYGGGPINTGPTYMETSAYLTPFTAQNFRAVFDQAGETGPRVVELDAYPPPY